MEDKVARPVFVGTMNQNSPDIPAVFIWAMIFLLLGLCFMAGSVFYDPSVETSGSYGIADRIVNTGRLQSQLMIFLSGCTFVVAGSALWAGASVYSLLREVANRHILDSFQKAPGFS